MNLLNPTRERRARMVMPCPEDFGFPQDVKLPQLAALVCLYNGPNAVVVQDYLCDRLMLPREPSGETLLALLIKRFVVQASGGGLVLNTRGVHLAERVVKKVMAGL